MNVSVSMIAAVHVGDVFTAGRSTRRDRFCEDLNRLIPDIKLGERRCDALAIFLATEPTVIDDFDVVIKYQSGKVRNHTPGRICN